MYACAELFCVSTNVSNKFVFRRFPSRGGFSPLNSPCVLIQTQIHNLQLIPFPSHCGKQKNLRDLILFLNAAWTACQMMSTAEEHPNILLHVAPFDHDKSYNPLQSFATYALSKRLHCAVLSKKTSNNLSTCDRILLLFPEKNCHVFSCATGQVYWNLLPMTGNFFDMVRQWRGQTLHHSHRS